MMCVVVEERILGQGKMMCIVELRRTGDATQFIG